MTLRPLALLALLLLAPLPALAQDQPPPPPPRDGDHPARLRDDPRRPVEKIARDLGVTPAEFRACFNDVQPAMGGSRPDGGRKHANKAVLLPCLQKANPDITNESLDEVMDRYRPGGRAGQE